MTTKHDASEDRDQCIFECLRCARTSEETLAHYLETSGSHIDAKHLVLLSDCAAICQLTAKFMIHDSDSHPLQCGVCAKMCRVCAENCEKFGVEFMNECAKVCKDCAVACQKIIEDKKRGELP